MNHKSILKEWPEGATHYSGGVYVKITDKSIMELDLNGEWIYSDPYPYLYDLVRLSDLADISFLKEKIEYLEKKVRDFHTIRTFP